MRPIDADALNDAMYHEAFENDASYTESNPMAKWDSGLWIRYKMFENAINEAPTIEPKRGEWIYGEHDVAMCDGYRCNRCDFFVPWDYEHKFIDFINDYHFCPNCGARMKGADDE